MLSHVVARRTWEIGVRVALGADRKKIMSMVLRDGLVPVGYGIAIGLVAGIMARMLLRLFFIRLLPALDPGVLTVVPLLMLLAGIAACYLPARRAARVDPNIALRELQRATGQRHSEHVQGLGGPSGERSYQGIRTHHQKTPSRRYSRTQILSAPSSALRQ